MNNEVFWINACRKRCSNIQISRKPWSYLTTSVHTRSMLYYVVLCPMRPMFRKQGRNIIQIATSAYKRVRAYLLAWIIIIGIFYLLIACYPKTWSSKPNCPEEQSKGIAVKSPMSQLK